MQRDWVCGADWKGPFSQSVFYLGAVLGTLLFGWVGDNYGRMPALYASNLVLMVTGLVTPLCTEFISFTFIRCGGMRGLEYYHLPRFLLHFQVSRWVCL